MTHIVTTTYRYKRPPKKRKAVALDAPAAVAVADTPPDRKGAPLAVACRNAGQGEPAHAEIEAPQED